MQKLQNILTIDGLNSVSAELNEKENHIVDTESSMYFDTLDEKLSDKRLKNLEQNKDWLISADEVFEE